MLFTSIRAAAARWTTELEVVKPSQVDGVAVTHCAIGYDVTHCSEPGSNPIQETIFFYFYCLRLTRLTLNKS